MKRLLLPLLLFSAACQMSPRIDDPVQVSDFGKTTDGTMARVIELANGAGSVARISTFGATLVSWEHEGTDIVLGFNDAASYEAEDNPYFGCTTGRVCNRIAEGEFLLNDRMYRLAVNNGPNHLHGGPRGLHRVHWRVVAFGRASNGNAWVRMSYLSPDGEEGYPGELDLTVQYTLTPKNVLRIEYEASSDQPTPVNLTNHSYFNLAGEGTILNHELQIIASSYTPTDDTMIPTGAIQPVTGSPLDFREPKAIGQHLGELVDTPAAGYDHNYVLDRPGIFPLQIAARLSDPRSGRRLEIWTQDIGLQLYTGNWLGEVVGRNGVAYPQYGGVCLEDQHFPDAVNQPEFPPVILELGETYTKVTELRLKR
jgi:aldose 1-epimerase